MNDCECSTGSIPLKRAKMRLASLLVGLCGLLLVTSCSVPFVGDDGDSESDPPAGSETTAPTPTAFAEPEVTVETNQSNWTVITGPERAAAPENRGDEQVLRMNGTTDSPATIDPALVRDTTSAFLARQIFRGLTRLDTELEVVPDLARQIEVSPDRRTYRFELHDGIAFHDGTPITADAVKASLERALSPALAEAHGGELPAITSLGDIQGAREHLSGEREEISGISVVDDLSLEIQLERGVVDFLERLSNPATFIVDVASAEPGGDWWRDANGSGPFVLDQWDDQRQIRLTPHDGYVRPPQLRAVEIRTGAEAVGEMRLYENDEIDIAQVPLSMIDRVDYEGSPIRGDLRADTMLSTTFVMVDPESEPFADERLRRALFRSFPRQDISEVMLDGRAQEAGGVLPTEMEGGASATFPYEHDPEAATALVDEAGLSEDDVITIYSSGGGIPVAMKHHFEETLGLPVEVVQLRWQDFMEDLRQDELSMFVLTWVADSSDPLTYLRALFHSESPENYIGYADDEVDALLDQAEVEQDNERRDSLIRDAQQRIMDSAVVMPLYHGVDYTLVAERVHGLETTPMGILGLETVWIEG